MQHDAEGLEKALAQAVKTRIDRFIRTFLSASAPQNLRVAPWMTLQAVRERHRNLVEHDWRPAAAEVFAAKSKDGDVSHPVKCWKILIQSSGRSYCRRVSLCFMYSSDNKT
jgi:hypothetical protein